MAKAGNDIGTRRIRRQKPPTRPRRLIAQELE